MNSIDRLIRAHLDRLAQRGRWTFLWRIWLEAVILAYVIGYGAQMLWPAGHRADLARLTIPGLLVLVLFVGPLSETITFQFLPLEFTATLRMRRSIRVGLSVIPFALMHHFAGIPTVAAAGIIGGFYLAITYEQWRKESTFVAIAMTFILHSSFNLVGAIGMIVLPP